ncbi:MAG: 6-phosphogluconolactonase [Desulfobacterales bacterium]
MTDRGPVKPRIQVFADPSALTRAAAEFFAETARRAVVRRGCFTVALAGGSTPRGLYQMLAQGKFSRPIDWPRVHLFWGDERCVPPGDPESNYGMVAETLLEGPAIPPHHIHPMDGSGEPRRAAAQYEQTLRRLFPEGAAALDLVLLGMGADGHTASLFPHAEPVAKTVTGAETRWVAAVQVPQSDDWRISLTPRFINSADCVVFLVAGRAKAQTLARVLAGPYQPLELPAQLIRPSGGSATWMVDAAAAKLLDASTRGAS